MILRCVIHFVVSTCFNQKKRNKSILLAPHKKTNTIDHFLFFFHIHDLLSRLKGGKGWLSQWDKEGWAEYLLHIYSSCHALLWCCTGMDRLAPLGTTRQKLLPIQKMDEHGWTWAKVSIFSSFASLCISCIVPCIVPYLCLLLVSCFRKIVLLRRD